ncbi:MAG: twin-arginine translocase subunit TatC, partial [Planctomycetota bacterium]
MALIDRFSGDIDERRMSLGEHLDELRKHVFKAVIWIALALVVCLCFQSELMKVATWPHTSCMRDLKRERETELAARKTGKPKFVQEAIDEVEAQDSLQHATRDLERNATFIRDKLAENPEAIVHELAKRRAVLADRTTKIREA